jgi:hypothetical protein
VNQRTAATLGELDGEIRAAEEDLRIWRKYNDDSWHDDPDYAAEARRLAALKRRQTRLQGGSAAEGG